MANIIKFGGGKEARTYLYKENVFSNGITNIATGSNITIAKYSDRFTMQQSGNGTLNFSGSVDATNFNKLYCKIKRGLGGFSSVDTNFHSFFINSGTYGDRWGTATATNNSYEIIEIDVSSLSGSQTLSLSAGSYGTAFLTNIYEIWLTK